MLVLVILSLAVVGLLLAQAAVSFFLGILRLLIILAAFACIGFIGLYLWRRGDIRGRDA
jgi:hypothetical protein